MSGIELTDLVIDVQATIGETYLLKGAYPTFIYENGTPTSNRDGTRYRVATPVGYLNVKVKGPQTIDFDADSKPVSVRFPGMDMYIYFRGGKPAVAGRAKAIEVVGEDT